MNENSYYLAPKWVFRGVLLGSLFVCLIGLYLSDQMAIPTRAEEDRNPMPTAALSIEEVTDIPTSISPSSGTAEQPEDCEVSEAYPETVRRWCSLITHAAKKHDLPADLIAAVIWIESGGNPLAYSRSGAVGLMQVMPRDGLASQFQCVNGPCFANRPTIEELQDPQFNINYGSKLLAGLAKKHGNYRDALKAYGPMQVGYTYADKVLSIYQKFGK
jgi:soluble lytic murein transglycosylase-like protein